MKSNPIKSIIFCAFLAILILFLFLNRCQKPTERVKIIHDTIYSKIESVRDSVRFKTEIRTKVVTKFKEIRHDSLIPCETKLYYCDTLVLADSALIAAYKQQTYLDSLYINYQAGVIEDTCKYYRKQIRKHKIQKWLIIAGAIGSHAIRK